jgi:tetratricopeptide (TPR) repeat protein
MRFVATRPVRAKHGHRTILLAAACLFSFLFLPAELQAGRPFIARGRGARNQCCSCAATTALRLGTDHARAGRLEAALAVYTSALKATPNNFELLYARAGVYAAFGRYSETIPDLQRAAKIRPKDVRVWEGLGYTYAELGRPQESEVAYSRTLALHRTAERFMGRGYARLQLGRNQDALADFNWAVYLNPTQDRPYLSRTNAYKALGRVDLALRDLDVLVRRNPSSVEPRILRAQIELERGRKDAAIADLTFCLTKEPVQAAISSQSSQPKTLSDDALRHGEQQLRRMLHDRPEMVLIAEEGSFLWNWALRKFAGEDLDSLVDWSPEHVSLSAAASYIPVGTEHAAVQVNPCDSSVPVSFRPDRLWSCFVFETFNLRAHAQFNELHTVAVQGGIERESYIRRTLAVEDQSQALTRRWYVNTFLPQLDSRYAEFTSPYQWHWDSLKGSATEPIAALAADPRCELYGAHYDLICAERFSLQARFAEVETLTEKIISKRGSLDRDVVTYALFLQGQARLAEERPSDALQSFDAALAANPDYYPALTLKAATLQNLGRLDEALQSFNEYVARHPDQADAYADRAYFLIFTEEYDKGIEDSDKALHLDPKLAVVYFNRAIAWRYKNDHDKALADYNEAIRLEPNFALAYIERSLIWLQKKEYDKAIGDCNEALRLEPENSSAYNSRGYAWHSMKEYETAVEDYDEALRLDPKNEYANSNKAFLLATASDEKFRNAAEALKLAEAALTINPQSAYAWSAKACALALQGDFKAAIECENKALEDSTYANYDGIIAGGVHGAARIARWKAKELWLDNMVDGSNKSP